MHFVISFIKSGTQLKLKIKIYKTIILPVVLYENGEWSRLLNEELHTWYCSPNIVRVIRSRRPRWTGHVARIKEGRSAFNILTGKRLLGRLRRRWDDNSRMDLKELSIHGLLH